MRPELGDELIEAISGYDYPATTYDFSRGCERCFSNMTDLDGFLRNLLRSRDAQQLKDGLSGILYWGHYRAGFRDHRVTKFREMVSNATLERSSEAIQLLDGTSLMELKKLGLPQFSNMAFITKLRRFLDPDRYCVLDSKIAKLAPLATSLKCQNTYIPINTKNERVYGWWIDSCSFLASLLQTQPRPVDVERGLFCLIDHERSSVQNKSYCLGQSGR
jgi:hypothetical protein